MFNQILISPQVKRSAIISNKHDTYELPHELPNDLRLKTLRHAHGIFATRRAFMPTQEKKT